MTDVTKNTFQQQEQMSSDVVAFCSLIARIMTRCLREKNPYVMEQLSLLSQKRDGEIGEKEDVA